jgi:hypothetical protein
MKLRQAFSYKNYDGGSGLDVIPTGTATTILDDWGENEIAIVWAKTTNQDINAIGVVFSQQGSLNPINISTLAVVGTGVAFSTAGRNLQLTQTYGIDKTVFVGKLTLNVGQED